MSGFDGRIALMTPVARTLEVLELLQSAGVRTATELAERFDVDERTIRRTVDRLRDLGIPIEARPGRYGGYRIAAGWRMPPLMLDENETVAVLAGLLAVPGSGTVPTDHTATATATAIAKIRRSLPARLAARADALLAAAVVGSPDAAPATDPEILLTAADAVRMRRPLTLDYRSGEDVLTRRTLQPHDLVAHRGRWYLVGLDSSSRQRRTFRLDRVRALRPLSGTFPAPAEHRPLEDLLAGFARADYRYRIDLRVRAGYQHIRDRLPAGLAIIEPLGDGADGEIRWWRVTIHAQRLDWLPPKLLALECPVVIDEPAELRDVVRAAASSLAAMAGCDQERPTPS